jgi:hypothetical protein
VRAALVVVAAACSGNANQPCGDCGDGGVDSAARDASRSPDAPVVEPPADAGVPPGAKRVFVTSLRYSANLRDEGGQATGRDSADAICQTLADAASLGGSFRAWLSTTDLDAIDHIAGTGPWYRLDGAVAFPNRASLGTTPQVPISIDEKLGHPDPFYESWTGTGVGGHLAATSLASATCYDWTSTVDSESIKGVLGVFGEGGGELDGTGPQWTNYAAGYCSPFSRHLYCFEQ